MTDASIVRSFYAAMGEGELDAALAHVAPDCAWTEMDGLAAGRTYHCPDEIRDSVFIRIGSAWDGFGLALDDVLDAGDTVVGLGTYTGTHRDTGGRLEARVAHVFRVRDGAIMRFEQFADTARIKAAAAGGASPA